MLGSKNLESVFKVHFALKNDEIGKKEAANSLIYIIEHSDDNRVIYEALNTMQKNSLLDTSLTKLVESIYVSYENSECRIKALEILIMYSPKIACNTIKLFLNSLKRVHGKGELIFTPKNKLYIILDELKRIINHFENDKNLKILTTLKEIILEINLKDLIFQNFSDLEEIFKNFITFYEIDCILVNYINQGNQIDHSDIISCITKETKKIMPELFLVINSIYSDSEILGCLKTYLIKQIKARIINGLHENPRKIINKLLKPLDDKEGYAYHFNHIFLAKNKESLRIRGKTSVAKIMEIKFLFSKNKIKKLALSDIGLDTLGGVKDFPNLEYIHLGLNNISDFTPLLECKKLKFISYWGNPISNWREMGNVLLHIERNKRTMSPNKKIRENLTNENILKLFIEGFKEPKEIAANLGISPKSVSMRLSNMGLLIYIRNGLVKFSYD